MCLYIKPYARRRIAKKDIPIYKKVKFEHHKWVTPYMEIEIPEDGILTPIEKFDHIPTRDDGYYSRCIEGGAIHCYKKPFIHGDFFRDDFFKGIIPKDIEYYVSDEGGEYAAMKIVLDMSRVISYP